MRSSSLAPTKLDLWVAGTMRADEGTRRLEQAGSTPDSAATVAHHLNTTLLAEPYVASAELVIQAFGVPASATSELLTYELSLWPLHYYVWRVLPDGKVVNKGFVLRASPQPVRLEAIDHAAASKAFEVWHDTIEDIERAVGTPRKRSGWWPEENLSYTTSQGQDLVFVFTHSLLSRIMVEEASED